MKAGWLTAGLIITGLTLAANAQDGKPQREGRHGPRSECLRSAHQAHRTATRTQMDTQREENQTFHDGLNEIAPETRIETMLKHRTAQYQENVAFHQAEYQKLVAAVKACEDVPAEVKEKILARLQEHHQEAITFHQGIHAQVLGFLKGLQASSDTPEQKLAAWNEFHEQIRDQVESWRAEHRPSRGPRGQAA